MQFFFVFIARPLNGKPSKKACDVYLELPSDCRHLYMNQRSPTPLRYDYKSVLEPKFKSSLGQFYSTGNDNNKFYLLLVN